MTKPVPLPPTPSQLAAAILGHTLNQPYGKERDPGLPPDKWTFGRMLKEGIPPVTPGAPVNNPDAMVSRKKEAYALLLEYLEHVRDHPQEPLRGQADETVLANSGRLVELLAERAKSYATTTAGAYALTQHLDFNDAALRGQAAMFGNSVYEAENLRKGILPLCEELARQLGCKFYDTQEHHFHR
jgi:hypothetical protein